MASFYEQKPWLERYPEFMSKVLRVPEGSTLGEFMRSAEKFPNDPCLMYFDKVLSYKEVRDMALALSGELGKMLLGPGDRAFIVMQNIPQEVIAFLAVWMRKAIAVPVNPMYTAKDLGLLMDDCTPRLVICQDNLYEEKVKAAVNTRKGLGVITTSPLDLLDDKAEVPKQLKDTKKLHPSDTIDFMELIKAGSGKPVEVLEPSGADLAYLIYTSGTTGPPKGAMVSNRNILANVMNYEAYCRLDRSDVVLGVAPLFHITGTEAHLAIAFHLGIPVVLFHRFDADDVLRLIDKYGVSFIVAAITAYIALLNNPNRKIYKTHTLTKTWSGGAPVSDAIVKKMQDGMNIKIHNVYGLTESTSPLTLIPNGMIGPIDEETGAFTVGLILPGHEAKIVDVEDPSKEMPPGQEGELVVRGPVLVSGYWEKPEETAHAIRDGWFFTGDVAKFDELGWCYLVNRKKDLINVSGYKVWPRDVEDVLYKHPAVKEASVVGVPDEYRGETVKAFVTVTQEYAGKVTPDDLISFCKEKMAAFKYPRIVEILDELPKTITGKVLRRELKLRGLPPSAKK